jgi:BirA family biotin operon repressor/biotin-[acetyl-CoA-carboxylase] ligase
VTFRIRHKAVTASTNLDARNGEPGDVFTADEQTAGRGRIDHRWLSPPRKNLTMSVVFDVENLSPEHVSTFPLMAGLAVRDAIMPFLPPNPPAVLLKWPNDVLADGRKISGILCERIGDHVIAGIGVNVGQTTFDEDIASRATSLALLRGAYDVEVEAMRDAVLAALGARHETWRAHGFAAIHADYAAADALRGYTITVRQTEDDASPVHGLCDGVAPDGTLIVAGRPVFAGEAHVLAAPCLRVRGNCALSSNAQL